VSSFRESARIFVVFFPFLLFGEMVPGCIPRTKSPFRRIGIQGSKTPNRPKGEMGFTKSPFRRIGVTSTCRGYRKPRDHNKQRSK